MKDFLFSASFCFFLCSKICQMTHIIQCKTLPSSEHTCFFTCFCTFFVQKSITFHLQNNANFHIWMLDYCFPANTVSGVEKDLPGSYQQPRIRGSCEYTFFPKLHKLSIYINWKLFLNLWFRLHWICVLQAQGIGFLETHYKEITCQTVKWC